MSEYLKIKFKVKKIFRQSYHALVKIAENPVFNFFLWEKRVRKLKMQNTHCSVLNMMLCSWHSYLPFFCILINKNELNECVSEQTRSFAMLENFEASSKSRYLQAYMLYAAQYVFRKKIMPSLHFRDVVSTENLAVFPALC